MTSPDNYSTPSTLPILLNPGFRATPITSVLTPSAFVPTMFVEPEYPNTAAIYNCPQQRASQTTSMPSNASVFRDGVDQTVWWSQGGRGILSSLQDYSPRSITPPQHVFPSPDSSSNSSVTSWSPHTPSPLVLSNEQLYSMTPQSSFTELLQTFEQSVYQFQSTQPGAMTYCEMPNMHNSTSTVSMEDVIFSNAIQTDVGTDCWQAADATTGLESWMWTGVGLAPTNGYTQQSWISGQKLSRDFESDSRDRDRNRDHTHSKTGGPSLQLYAGMSALGLDLGIPQTNGEAAEPGLKSECEDLDDIISVELEGEDPDPEWLPNGLGSQHSVTRQDRRASTSSPTPAYRRKNYRVDSSTRSSVPKVSCDICKKGFSRPADRHRHMMSAHPTPSHKSGERARTAKYSCERCRYPFTRFDALTRHLKNLRMKGKECKRRKPRPSTHEVSGTRF